MTTWTTETTVTDHGPWLPDQPEQAARLIAILNDKRQATDPWPQVRILFGHRFLDGWISGKRVYLLPHWHLVSTVLGHTETWAAVPPNRVQALR